jgi:hypothetical protein
MSEPDKDTRTIRSGVDGGVSDSGEELVFTSTIRSQWDQEWDGQGCTAIHDAIIVGA